MSLKWEEDQSLEAWYLRLGKCAVAVVYNNPVRIKIRLPHYDSCYQWHDANDLQSFGYKTVEDLKKYCMDMVQQWMVECGLVFADERKGNVGQPISFESLVEEYPNMEIDLGIRFNGEYNKPHLGDNGITVGRSVFYPREVMIHNDANDFCLMVVNMLKKKP